MSYNEEDENKVKSPYYCQIKIAQCNIIYILIKNVTRNYLELQKGRS